MYLASESDVSGKGSRTNQNPLIENEVMSSEYADLFEPEHAAPKAIGQAGSLISPALVVKGLRKHALWIVLLTGFGSVGGLGLAMNITPTYEARTVMLRHTKNNSANPALYNELGMRTLLETVKLRDNLQKLNTRFQLNTPPETLFKQIEVKQGNRNDIIQILARDTNPQRAAQISQGVSEIFQASSAGLSQQVATRVFQFRQKQRQRFQDRLVQAQQQMKAFQKKHQIAFFKDSTRLLLEQIKQLELDLERAKIQQNRDKQAVQNIQSRLKNRPETVRVTQTLRYRNRVRYEQLQSEIRALLKRYTPKNPKVIAAQEQLAALAQENKDNSKGVPEEESYGMDPVVRELKIDRAKRETELQGHRKTVAQLKGKLQSQRAQLKKRSALENDMANLQRNIDRVNENLRENDYRLSESENAMNAKISTFDILEPASVPDKPLPTRRKLIVLMGAFAGFLLGAGASALKSILKSTLSNAEQMQSLPLPNLGVLQNTAEHVESLKLGQQTLSFFDKLIEQAASKELSNPPLVLVVSAEPNSGKSVFMSACETWLEQQQKTGAFINSAQTPVLPTHDIGQLIYNANTEAPAPLPIKKSAYISHYAFQKQARLPMLNRLSEFWKKDLENVPYIVLWELQSVQEAEDLYHQLLPEAQGVIWVVRKDHSSHKILKTGISEAAKHNRLNENIRGVWNAHV